MAVSRRSFLKLGSAALAAGILPSSRIRNSDRNWIEQLPLYHVAACNNIVKVGKRRALLSSRSYPGAYVRDALFWGPLGLNDPQLGWECYQWFADSQLRTGQIRTSIPLRPGDASQLEDRDDESALLFILASEWLSRFGYPVDKRRVSRAWSWITTHLDHCMYWQDPGPFRYWADTVTFEERDCIAHNQGLFCLAARSMWRLGFSLDNSTLQNAQQAYRDFYNDRYIRMSMASKWSNHHDISAIFPEFLSRYLFEESILQDESVLNHVSHLVTIAGVWDWHQLAGIKVISGSNGRFLPPDNFFAPGLNDVGNYQNGGEWPLYTIAALALAYKIRGQQAYADYIGQLVSSELSDGMSKEVIRLTPGAVGQFDAIRVNYTWNALIPVVCSWAGLV